MLVCVPPGAVILHVGEGLVPSPTGVHPAGGLAAEELDLGTEVNTETLTDSLTNEFDELPGFG